ncbi:kinase-like protein [Ophiobolus disseminans]|uniref:non-specific serine/threonine protein kinase n=1 Tax=Ophiobolus disseminans TaxID=1469910 RepID=A0A6A6ZRB5_9PLEO|nr:kinase-like protein [Ophiobolus disseminans]
MATTITSDDETLIDDHNPTRDDRITIDDWSQTGRGSHVEFDHKEIVPLGQDRFLGRGAMGDVYETTVQGWKIAHKRIVVKRKIGAAEKREIDILKRLSSHTHMIQLVGTYTHRQFLGILLYPVAICDLHTFFEDVEAWSSLESEDITTEARLQHLDPVHKDRLEALGYNFPRTKSRYWASPVYSRIGCLISAIAYLHDQKIRHKDLKPSNILLSQDRLWLSDFGSATDFSLLSQSATDNERGTPRYFSPEVAAWQPNGRAADVFSLGCILLEILVLHDRGSLEHIRQNRSPDPSFHANLDRIETWRTSLEQMKSHRRHFILQEIGFMLLREPAARPTAEQLLTRVTAYDLATISRLSLFGNCCKSILVTRKSHQIFERNRRDLEKQLQVTKEQLESERDDMDRLRSKHKDLCETRHDLQKQLGHDNMTIKEYQLVLQHQADEFVKEKQTLMQKHADESAGRERKNEAFWDRMRLQNDDLWKAEIRKQEIQFTQRIDELEAKIASKANETSPTTTSRPSRSTRPTSATNAPKSAEKERDNQRTQTRGLAKQQSGVQTPRDRDKQGGLEILQSETLDVVARLTAKPQPGSRTETSKPQRNNKQTVQGERVRSREITPDDELDPFLSRSFDDDLDPYLSRSFDDIEKKPWDRRKQEQRKQEEQWKLEQPGQQEQLEEHQREHSRGYSRTAPMDNQRYEVSSTVRNLSQSGFAKRSPSSWKQFKDKVVGKT